MVEVVVQRLSHQIAQGEEANGWPKGPITNWDTSA